MDRHHRRLRIWGHNSSCPPGIELSEVTTERILFGVQQDTRDEKSREHEEKVYAHPQQSCSESVVQEHCQDSQASDPVKLPDSLHIQSRLRQCLPTLPIADAGLPKTLTRSATSLTTMLPAPTKAHGPTLTLGRIQAWLPRKTPSPRVADPLTPQ